MPYTGYNISAHAGKGHKLGLCGPFYSSSGGSLDEVILYINTTKEGQAC